MHMWSRISKEETSQDIYMHMYGMRIPSCVAWQSSLRVPVGAGYSGVSDSSPTTYAVLSRAEVLQELFGVIFSYTLKVLRVYMDERLPNYGNE